MKKICFHIQKGGVGKTSISGTVAHSLARRGKKTVLLDCDPQGNISSWFCRQALDYDIADILSGKINLDKVIIPLAENLFLIPVIAIGGNLKKWSETELVQSPRAFEFLMGDIEAGQFDYAVCDCSPSFSQLERAVIAAMDEVINPLSPEFFSVDGIEIFTSELAKIEKANRRKITNNKIVVNMLNKSFTRHKEFYQALQGLKYSVFMIPQDSRIAECQIAHESLYDFAPAARSIPDFETLTSAILAG
jgi:cellulose biosynthesis protein BcsQ